MTDTILRLPKVIETVGLSRSTIYKKIEDGEFPAQVKLGVRSVGWLKSEIEEWLTSKAADRA